MSVLVAKRKESKAEYVFTAQELLEHVLRSAKKFPKSITFYVTQDFVTFARDAYTYVYRANKVFLNKDNYELRRKYLQSAYDSLNGLESLSTILFNSYYNSLTKFGWIQLNDFINKERNLIKSVMESDTKRL